MKIYSVIYLRSGSSDSNIMGTYDSKEVADERLYALEATGEYDEGNELTVVETTLNEDSEATIW